MTRARDLADLGGSANAGTVTGESLIINGDMAVAQRGDKTGIINGYGGADRWLFARVGAAAATLSQETDVPSNQGFSYSQKVDITTADNSLAAGDYGLLLHRIEGQNLQHLLYGTSEAKKLTLQFWVKSSKTGTHVVEFGHIAASYQNSQTYTISTADTWQKVTMTFDGYTPTNFTNDNSNQLQLVWWLAAGSTFSGGTLSENTWHNTSANRAAGQVNVLDSTSNAFYITGVKLEVGSTATPFKYETYAENLNKCQRYYVKKTPGNGSIIGIGMAYGTTSAYTDLYFPVEMRTTPSGTFSSTNGHWEFRNRSGDITNSGAPNITSATAFSARMDMALNGQVSDGSAGWIEADDAAAYYELNAEL